MIWNAARAASKRPLRKPYKACGPVGEVPPLHKANDHAMRMRAPMGLLFEQDFMACVVCGHHWCSCRSKGASFAHRMGILEGLQELDMLDDDARKAALNLLLTGDPEPAEGP